MGLDQCGHTRNITAYYKLLRQHLPAPPANVSTKEPGHVEGIKLHAR